MQKGHESTAAKRQKQEIIRRLTEDVLHTTVSPLNPESFYQQRPTDPRYLELYEQAQGDPVHYALLCNVEDAKDKLLAAKESDNSLEYLDARYEIEDARVMVQQYLDPEGNPFDV
jgi:hypothetical protein